MLSNKACPGNSRKFRRKRRRLLIISVLIFTLLFPYSIIAQQLYSLEYNYDISSPELIQGLIDEEVTPLASNKSRKSVIQFKLFILNSFSQNLIYTYQLIATFHDKPTKVILRL